MSGDGSVEHAADSAPERSAGAADEAARPNTSGSAERRLAALDRARRVALCREVMERLSDLVEGEAPADFCERVADWLEECQPFRAYRDTLAETIELARELGRQPPAAAGFDEARVAECIERVRRRLARKRRSPGGRRP